MKTLFLITVLFVLLAFAFKSPEQSAWEFATEFGDDITEKVSPNDEGDSASGLGIKREPTVDDGLNDIRRFLEKSKPSKKLVEDTPRKPRKVKKQPPAAPKEPQVVEVEPNIAEPLPKVSPLPKDPVETSPNSPPRWIEEPKVKKPQFPDDSDKRKSHKEHQAELAERGAKYDHASRLLEPIK